MCKIFREVITKPLYFLQIKQNSICFTFEFSTMSFIISLRTNKVYTYTCIPNSFIKKDCLQFRLICVKNMTTTITKHIIIKCNPILEDILTKFLILWRLFLVTHPIGDSVRQITVTECCLFYSFIDTTIGKNNRTCRA